MCRVVDATSTTKTRTPEHQMLHNAQQITLQAERCAQAAAAAHGALSTAGPPRETLMQCLKIRPSTPPTSSRLLLLEDPPLGGSYSKNHTPSFSAGRRRDKGPTRCVQGCQVCASVPQWNDVALHLSPRHAVQGRLGEKV